MKTKTLRTLYVKQNIELLIDRAGINATELAKLAGVSQPTVHRILTGESKDPKTSTLQPIAEYFGMSADDLRSKDLSVSDPGDLSVSLIPASLGYKKIPVLTHEQAILFSTISYASYNTDNIGAYMLTDQQVSNETFALEVIDDSMAPDFQSGDRIVIDPVVRPKPGAYVVAKQRAETTDQLIFRRYRHKGANEKGIDYFELIPLNDNYAVLRSDVYPLSVIGTMIEHRRYYK